MARIHGGHTLGHLFLALALLSGGCGSANPLGPDNLEVMNGTDTFQWQASALVGVTQTLTYTWTNTGTTADVNQASAISAGAASFRLTDGTGAEVYSGDLNNNGTFQTTSGAAGYWTVTITLTGATGTVNFRLQKP